MFRVILAIAFSLSATCAMAQNIEASANKLLVEAIQLYQSAEAAPEDEKHGLYARVQRNLDDIVGQYPGSSAAVKVLTERKLGPIDQKVLGNRISYYHPDKVAARRAEAERKRAAAAAEQNLARRLAMDFLQDLSASGESASGRWNVLYTATVGIEAFFFNFTPADGKFEYVIRTTGFHGWTKGDMGVPAKGTFGGQGRILERGHMILFDSAGGPPASLPPKMDGKSFGGWVLSGYDSTQTFRGKKINVAITTAKVPTDPSVAREAGVALPSTRGALPTPGAPAYTFSKAETREMQRRLLLLGFDPKGVDGAIGPGTKGAIREWQIYNGHGGSGTLTPDQWAALKQQSAARYDAWAKANPVQTKPRGPQPNALDRNMMKAGYYWKNGKWCKDFGYETCQKPRYKSAMPGG